MEELKKTTYRASLVVVKDEAQSLRPVPGKKNDKSQKSKDQKMPEPAQRVYKAKKHDPL